jgi:hypothetical protein
MDAGPSPSRYVPLSYLLMGMFFSSLSTLDGPYAHDESAP